MNVQDWSISRIMQLPDWCFGRRFLVPVFFAGDPDLNVWVMSEEVVPERAVLWEFALWEYDGISAGNIGVEFALGDQVPADQAEFYALEPLFREWRRPGPGVTQTVVGRWQHIALRQLRYVLQPGSRHIVMHIATILSSIDVHANFVVSSMPTEVPDWLISP